METAVKNKVGYKKTKLGWIPEDWEEVKLEKIISKFVVPMRDKPRELSGEIPWCRIEDFEGKYLFGSKSRQGVSEQVVKDMNLKVYPEGTLLVSCSANLGKCAIVGNPLVTNQTFIGLVPIVKNVDTELLYYIMISSAGRLNRLSTGTTISYLSREEFEKFNITLPKSLPEQQKIATILSTWDNAIDKLTQLITAKEQRKKGLMQLLLTGKKRFAGYADEWEEVKLGDVATFLKGKGISKNDIAENGKTPCIRYGELYTTYNEIISSVVSHTNVDARNLVLSEEDDVIIPASGETALDIATASCVKNKNVALGGDLNIIRSEIDGVFLSYYLNTSKKHDIAKLAQGISVIHLYTSQLKTLQICLPKKVEQQKIASALSSVDKEIELLKQELSNFQQQKKGLMQKLLTGEVRVKIN